MGNIQIGASSLNDEQLKMTIPDSDIMEDIEMIREAAKNVVTKDIDEKDIDSILRKYNNIISVLGERGSGKTSVLLTIQEKLEEKNKNKGYMNILFPLIKPDCIGNNKNEDTVIGWLIGGFGKIVEEIENDIYESKKYKVDNKNTDYFQNCRKRNDNKLRCLYNQLIEYYLYSRREYQDIIKNEYESFNSYVENISYSVDSEQKLFLKFYDFINEVILILKKSENSYEPLIFFFFDDIELSVDRCEEVINVISKYLLHPNIVVLIAGDIKQFRQRLLVDLLNRDNLINLLKEKSDQLNTNSQKILEESKLLVNDILKKAMPPALRKSIHRLSLDEKYNFIYDGNNTLERLMYKVIIENNIGQDKSKIELLIQSGFLTKTEFDDKARINKAFFNIFDDTPRSIMNMCYLLNTFGNQKLDYHKINRFIDAIVEYSSELGEYKNDIYEILDSNVTKRHNEYEDAVKVMNALENKKEDKAFFKYNYKNILSKIKLLINKDAYKKIFILIVFIENIESVIESREIHGSEIINPLFNDFNQYGLKMYPELKNPNVIIEMYSELQTLSFERFEGGLYEKNYFLLQYFKIINKIAKINKFNLVEFFNLVSSEDLEWGKDKADIITNQSLKKYHVMSEIIKNIKEQCFKMRADNSFIIDLNNELNRIMNGENQNYEEFDDRIVSALNNCFINTEDKCKIKIDNGKLKEELLIKYRNKVFEHLYTFSANCVRFYFIDENIRIALSKLIAQNAKREIISTSFIKTINDYMKYESINEYDFNTLLNQLDYNIKLQPQYSIYQDIKNIFSVCQWAFRLQEDYNTYEYVNDFIIYILISYLSYEDKEMDYYNEFLKLYNELVNYENSYVREYMKGRIKNFRVIV